MILEHSLTSWLLSDGMEEQVMVTNIQFISSWTFIPAVKNSLKWRIFAPVLLLQAVHHYCTVACMFTWSQDYQHQTVQLYWREGSCGISQHPVAASLSQVQDPSSLLGISFTKSAVQVTPGPGLAECSKSLSGTRLTHSLSRYIEGPGLSQPWGQVMGGDDAAVCFTAASC